MLFGCISLCLFLYPPSTHETHSTTPPAHYRVVLCACLYYTHLYPTAFAAHHLTPQHAHAAQPCTASLLLPIPHLCLACLSERTFAFAFAATRLSFLAGIIRDFHLPPYAPYHHYNTLIDIYVDVTLCISHFTGKTFVTYYARLRARGSLCPCTHTFAFLLYTHLPCLFTTHLSPRTFHTFPFLPHTPFYTFPPVCTHFPFPGSSIPLPLPSLCPLAHLHAPCGLPFPTHLFTCLCLALHMPPPHTCLPSHPLPCLLCLCALPILASILPCRREGPSLGLEKEVFGTGGVDG